MVSLLGIWRKVKQRKECQGWGGLQFEIGVLLQEEDSAVLTWRYKERTYEYLAEDQFRKMK